MHKIRFIIDNNNTKVYNQYNQICNLLPMHSLYIYKKGNNIKEEHFDYNLYFDVISERVYNDLCPAKYTILLVNDEYINTQKYLRREFYIDKPLILLSDIVNYYFCLTKYCKNILFKQMINKNKIFYLKGFANNIYDLYNINFEKQKYILYNIDQYSDQNNLVLLTTWLKYFTNRPEKLIIIYKYYQDSIVKYNYELFKRKEFKNIILTNDINILDSNIFASIINTSPYSLTTTLYDNILRDRIVITVDTSIIDDILKPKSCILMDDFNEENIYKALNKLFEYKDSDIIKITNKNKNELLKKSKKTKTEIYKFFKLKKSNNSNICEKLIFRNNDFKLPFFIKNKIIQSHLVIKSEMDEIDKKFNKIKNNNSEKSLSKYYRILKMPDKQNKTKYAFATLIILNNTYIPTILSNGYIMKYIHKTKYNLICFVQDKPYYENDIIRFPGLTQDEINDIMKIYDCVIGIDLLKIETNKKIKLNFEKKYYSNAKFYATKLICYGFTLYSKILYYDASTIIYSNVDYYMTKYNENKYFNPYNFDTQRGLMGSFYFYIPKTYYIKKALYLLKNYERIFENQYDYYLPDEDLLYYTLYPNWSDKQIDGNEIKYNDFLGRFPYIHQQKKEKYKYNFYLIVNLKPFLYNIQDDNTLFTSNNTCYDLWDEGASDLIIKYPELNKYFEFIKTFRYTLF